MSQMNQKAGKGGGHDKKMIFLEIFMEELVCEESIWDEDGGK